MPHWSEHIVFSLLFTAADGMKKIPWVATCEGQEKKLPEVSSVALLVGLLQEYGATWKGEKIHEEFPQRKHRWSHTYVYTCVLIQRKDGYTATSSLPTRCSQTPVANVMGSARFQSTCFQFSGNEDLQCTRCVTCEGELAISPRFYRI